MLRTLLVPIVLGLTAAMALADPAERVISGQITYDARIALPEGAETRVIARGLFGTTLGHSAADTGGAQVPLDFRLNVPADLSGQITALIRIDGAPRWIARHIDLPVGDADLDLGLIRLQPYSPLAFVTTYDCGSTRVMAGIDEDHLTLRIGDSDIAMRADVSASGARFVAADGSDTVFWSKGDSAALTLRGTEFPLCIRQDDVGQPYRAGGNEPGWSVRLLDGLAEITADYGAITHSTPHADPVPTPGAYVIDMPDLPARLTLTDRLCRDDMTGMPHPQGAVLDLDGQVLPGCGGAPVDLLAGIDWQIARIGDAATLAGVAAKLSFAADGRIGGTTGCNRLMGSFNLTGEGLSLGEMAATRMACPEALMAQERSVIAALEQVSRFDLDDTGALLLIGGPHDAPVLTLMRP